MLKFGEISKTPDHSDIGCFHECDLSYPDSLKEKNKEFPFFL